MNWLNRKKGAASALPGDSQPLLHFTLPAQSVAAMEMFSSFGTGSSDVMFGVAPAPPPGGASVFAGQGGEPFAQAPAPIARDIAQLLLPHLQQFGADIDINKLSTSTGHSGLSMPTTSSAMPTMSPEVSGGPSSRRAMTKRKMAKDGEPATSIHWDLVTSVRQIVCEELERHSKSMSAVKAEEFGCVFNQPHEAVPVVSSLSAMPGVADSRTDPLQQHHHTFPDDVTHHQHAYRGTATNQHLEDHIYYSQRPRAAYPEVYNVGPPSPVCYSCGAIRHITGFCRLRRQTRYSPPLTWPNFKGVNDDHWLAEHQATNTTSSPPRNSFRHSNRRSDSPASDCSLTSPTSCSRRSPSPQRRFTPPPLSGN
ncbi:hypothetical protein HPB51_013148 [Rhipicephalus microplus]|uniref:Uncharacterized protein n=1 Tax=Rhipicephalus microplus TaxID=6941 RepID=A0A9J6E1R6_RHIMP|nr:hypothetical protein HPB51_013148 [Rhipicephalus microplus]